MALHHGLLFLKSKQRAKRRKGPPPHDSGVAKLVFLLAKVFCLLMLWTPSVVGFATPGRTRHATILCSTGFKAGIASLCRDGPSSHVLVSGSGPLPAGGLVGPLAHSAGSSRP